MKRRSFVTQAAVAALSATTFGAVQAGTGSGAVRIWNGALTSALAATFADPTISSRAHSMVYEAVYNAWAAHDWIASFTLSGMRRQPYWRFSNTNKVVALSWAAYVVLGDLFPSRQASFDQTLAQVLADTSGSAHASAARDVGLAAAAALLTKRHNDGSNQLGNLAAGAYSDYTGYAPVNGPDTLVDPTRWQPLRIVNLLGQPAVQSFLTPHWGRVKPFALPSGSALRPTLGQAMPTWAEMDELFMLSAGLDDTTKSVVDFWAANPGSITPSGMWSQIAEQVSLRDGNSLDADVKMFFAVGQALLDAGIAVWEAKRYYDSVRPITALRWYFRDVWTTGWGGPGTSGPYSMPGILWMPYQRAIRPSPNFPEYPSGHSGFSAAAATVLAGLRGSDNLALSFVFPAGGVPFDRSVPAQPVTLSFATLSAAADQAGWSRRLGGIHFERGDLHSRALGKQVGSLVLKRCVSLFNGA